MVPDSGTLDLWPQWSSDRAGSNETGFGMTSLSPKEEGTLVKLQKLKPLLKVWEQHTIVSYIPTTIQILQNSVFCDGPVVGKRLQARR